MFLEHLKTTNLEPGQKYIFVVPMGATEQHGPFLPLGTDTYIQKAIVKGAEKALPEAIFLPTLAITCSKEHGGFAGSIWVEKGTMELILRDVCASLQPYAKAIMFASWHGGNISLLDQFIEKYRDQFSNIQLIHAKFDSDETMKRTEGLLGGEVDEHAGNSEISMMLAIDQSIVAIPDPAYPKREIRNARDSDRVKDVSEDGIVDNHPKWVIDKGAGE